MVALTKGLPPVSNVALNDGTASSPPRFSNHFLTDFKHNSYYFML
jgi:hypothetical protein